MPAIFTIEDVSFENFILYKNMEIQERQMTFLCGASGCGKSSLLRLLNTTVSPSTGRITYKGQDLNMYDTIAYRRKVILVTQNFYLFEDSIKENFALFYESRMQPCIAEEEMKKFLKLCCIDVELDISCKRLSGGERQRVFLAICLSLMPETLLLDEPTSALDLHTAQNVLKNIKDFCRENCMTAIVICHQQELAKEFADTIVTLT